MSTTRVGEPRTEAQAGVATDGGPALRIAEHAVGPDIDADLEAWEKELKRLDYCPESRRRGPKMVRELQERFGWRTARDAQTAEITTWLADRGGSGATQNNKLSVLSVFFEYCRKNRKTIRENPCNGIERTHVEMGDGDDGVREFTIDEMRRAIGAANGWWRVACIMFATTALRRGAVFRGVKCRHFNRRQRRLDIPKKVLKNGRALKIPLVAFAYAAIEAATAGRAPDEPIIPVKFDQDTWLLLLKRAGIEHTDADGRAAGTHSFRKGAAAAMLESGAVLPDIRDLLGHSDIRLTERIYARTGEARTLSRRGDAMKILEAVNPDPTGVSARSPGGGSGNQADEGLTNETGYAEMVPANPPMNLTKTQPGENPRLPIGAHRDGSLLSTNASGGRGFQPGCERSPVGSAALIPASMTPRRFELRGVTSFFGAGTGPTEKQDGDVPGSAEGRPARDAPSDATRQLAIRAIAAIAGVSLLLALIYGPGLYREVRSWFVEAVPVIAHPDAELRP